MRFIVSIISLGIYIVSLFVILRILKKRYGCRLDFRCTIFGLVLFLLFGYLLTGSIHRVLMGVIPAFQTPFGVAISYAFVCTTFMILGYYLLYKLFGGGGQIGIAAAVSIAFGAGLLEFILTVMATLFTVISAQYHVNKGDIAAWLGATTTNATEAQIQATGEYYANMSFEFILFLGVIATACMVYHVLLSCLMGGYTSGQSTLFLIIAVVYTFSYAFMYQYIPMLNYTIAIISAVTFILVSILILRKLMPKAAQ